MGIRHAAEIGNGSLVRRDWRLTLYVCLTLRMRLCHHLRLCLRGLNLRHCPHLRLEKLLLL